MTIFYFDLLYTMVKVVVENLQAKKIIVLLVLFGQFKENAIQISFKTYNFETNDHTYYILEILSP